MTKKITPPAGPVAVCEIDVKTLRDALKDVVDVVEARNTLPILSNVLLSIGPSAMVVQSTDLDIWAERHVSVAGDSMTLTVEAAVLRRIVDKLPEDASARLAYAEGKLTVSAGRSRFVLSTLPADDFPTLPRRDWDAEFEMPALTLSAALSTVSFAMSTDEVRYYLMGVLVHSPSETGDLRFAATDGHRLARLALPLPDGAIDLPDIIIPRKVVKVLTGLLDRHSGSVDVRVGAERIRVEIGETVVQSKLIDGTFPDYTRVIPTSHATTVSVDREALLAAVGRVVTVSSDKVKSVKVEIDRDLMTLSVFSPETGSATEEVPCDHSGPALTIGFNAKFLQETLARLTADVVEGSFSDAAAPSLWRDGPDSAAVFVVMPMRV